MFGRGLLLLVFSLVPALATAVEAANASTGLQNDVTFALYSPLSGSSELARRLVSPLNALRLQQQAAVVGTTIREQPIALGNERFALYVPTREPPDGYGLLVFVPPWNEARVPPAWIATLERQGVILVSAANAGNDANVLDRRDPLALLAAWNVMARYHVDPHRIYVGGFSGGSRVALRLALGYPDLFRGALLDAGSDAIGAQIPPPSRELMHQFQASTRVVYLTGEHDAFHEKTDRESRQSLEAWCVFDIDTEAMPGTGHELADASAFDRALTSLGSHKSADVDRLAACRAHVDNQLSELLGQVQHLLAQHDMDGARRLLGKIDARYGGLAAPRSIELAGQLGTQP